MNDVASATPWSHDLMWFCTDQEPLGIHLFRLHLHSSHYDNYAPPWHILLHKLKRYALRGFLKEFSSSLSNLPIPGLFTSINKRNLKCQTQRIIAASTIRTITLIPLAFSLFPSWGFFLFFILLPAVLSTLTQPSWFPSAGLFRMHKF